MVQWSRLHNGLWWMETLEVSWMDQRIQSKSTSLGCPALLGETLVVLDTSHLFGHHILAANGGTGLKYILLRPVKKNAWCFKWMVLAAHWQDQKMVLPHVAPTKSQASWKNAYDFFGRIQPLRIWLWKLQKQAMEDDSVCLRIARTGFLHFFRGSTRSGHLLTHFVNIYAKSIRPWILADLWSWKFYSQLATLFRDGKNWLHQ